MARLTPQEFQEKQARRLKASLEDIKKGVGRVTESPTEKAAAKADKFVAGVQKSVEDGKWQAGLRKVSLDQWKSDMINKGVNRIPAGIDAAREKVVDFASQLLPHIDSLQSKVKSMPDLTLEVSIARMTAFTRGMAEFKKK